MRDFSLGRVLIVCLFVGFASACSKPLPAYRYELIVEVDTPEGLRTGSSIVEVRASGEPRILPDSGGVFTEVTGEAAVVDLPKGSTLFALLQGERSSGDADRIARATFIPRSKRIGIDSKPAIYADVARSLQRASGFATVPPEAYPLLVRFENMSDPASAKRVDPEDLASSFGPGTKLRRIAMRITQGTGRARVEARLPWVGTGRYVIASRLNGSDNLISAYDFKRE